MGSTVCTYLGPILASQALPRRISSREGHLHLHLNLHPARLRALLLWSMPGMGHGQAHITSVCMGFSHITATGCLGCLGCLGWARPGWARWLHRSVLLSKPLLPFFAFLRHLTTSGSARIETCFCCSQITNSPIFQFGPPSPRPARTVEAAQSCNQSIIQPSMSCPACRSTVTLRPKQCSVRRIAAGFYLRPAKIRCRPGPF